MSIGLISKSLAAIRKEPSDRSEMVNQMIFGESVDIVEDYKGWLRIIGHLDQYYGWVDSKLVDVYDQLPLQENYRVSSRFFSAQQQGSEFPVLLSPGSTLSNYSNGNFKNGDIPFTEKENPFTNTFADKQSEIESIAKNYINSPYLWGGRSPMGIDCSGLVQVVHKIAGIILPRDASQQALTGNTVDYIDNVQTGDLAFFDNDEGIITHVGIIIGNNSIIHSSGYVKIDKFDHQGIFNLETGKYSHKLRVVKRLY